MRLRQLLSGAPWLYADPWEQRHRLTGYWFAPAPDTWTPPAHLAAFVEAGEPPVVVSLGAMALSGEDSLEAAQITLAAVQQAGVCAVIQGWEEAIRQLPCPATVFHANSVPHDWLLPRTSGLVIPHIIDQFIWGNKVAQLGVGPEPIPRPTLKADTLAASLHRMQAPDMRQKAADVGAAIRAEPDGVLTAVHLIEGAPGH